jgi:hypothetical protein
VGRKDALLVSLSLVAVLASSCATNPATRAAHSPDEVVLWAWHGPHDLRFLADRKGSPAVSVAYLARRLVVDERGVHVQPRRAPLRLAPGSPSIAVVRIESAAPPAVFARHRPRILEHLAIAASEEGVAALQVDFDAGRSLRREYLGLLEAARDVLHPGQRLEMTSLASWCMGDRWIDGVDAAVPMVFEMGPASAELRAALAAAERFEEPACRGQIGVSTTDRMPPLRGARRVFVFAPGPWTEERVDRSLAALAAGRWDQ